MTTFVSTVASFRQGARGLPREYFTSAAIFTDELERLFLARWLCACREDEVARRGDYRLVEIAGESVIVLRDAGGRLRAFYNVCRHRGARLCDEHSGRLRNTIQCPYHAWTYRLDGSLAGAPHMHDCEGFDRGDYQLHAVAVDTWEGFVFLNLAADPEPLELWISPLGSRFSRFNISELRSARRIEYDVAANWKLIFQNYSECLHCPTIHPELAERTPYTSGENDLVEGPFLGGFMALTDGEDSLTTSGEACAIPVAADLPPEDLRRIYFYSIMPNLLLSLYPDYVMFHTLWPESAGRTRIVCEWLFHPDAAGGGGYRPDDAIEFWDRTNRQDWRVCESSQAGASSRAYTPGPYSPQESLPAAWDREYLRRMQG